MNLDVHHYDLAVVHRNRCTIYMWSEVPGIEGLALSFTQRSVIVENGHRAVIEVHIDIEWLERSLKLLYTLPESDWEVIGCLIDHVWLRNWCRSRFRFRATK